MNVKPQLSIGLPVYNGEKTIGQSIDSLLKQDFEDLELIISDNGSTDRTQDICREYAQKDRRVKYYRNKINQGPIWNFNNVFQLASADYFMWASHDDYWAPAYLQTCLEALDRSDAVILAGCTCESIDAVTSQIILTDPGVTTVGLKPEVRFRCYKQALHTGKNINALFYGIYRKDHLAQVMPLRNILAIDQILLAQLSLSGEFLTSEKRLMVKRWGGGSASLKKSAQMMRITNPLFVHFAYLVRESILQRVIYTSDSLNFLGKINLSIWSWGNYLILFLRLRYRFVRDFIKSMLGFIFRKERAPVSS
jgi:glycosyltransferase involved in cell wall biosynthesis